MDTATLTELTAQLAAALGTGWYAATDDERWHTLHGPAGLALHVSENRCRRLEIRSATYGLHRHIWREPVPQITVAPNRSAAAIAAEIQRRLLPDAQAFRATLLERQARLDEAARATDQVAALLVATGEVTTHNRSQDNTDLQLSGTRSGSPWLRGAIRSGTVELELHSLSPEQARAVLLAIANQSPPPVE